MGTHAAPRIVGQTDGKSGVLAAIGVRFVIGAEDADGRFSLVEHPMPPRALAAPLHRHSREDEYSFVLEGRMGAQLGEEVVYAEAGDLVFKPRDQWHTFWNAGDEPCRILELISPAGFERYFEELVDMAGPKTPDTIAPIASRYGLESNSKRSHNWSPRTASCGQEYQARERQSVLKGRNAASFLEDRRATVNSREGDRLRPPRRVGATSEERIDRPLLELP
jgi:mannose-6-phosphate isomerase-like protein (cupin superfamily)